MPTAEGRRSQVKCLNARECEKKRRIKRGNSIAATLADRRPRRAVLPTLPSGRATSSRKIFDARMPVPRSMAVSVRGSGSMLHATWAGVGRQGQIHAGGAQRRRCQVRPSEESRARARKFRHAAVTPDGSGGRSSPGRSKTAPYKEEFYVGMVVIADAEYDDASWRVGSTRGMAANTPEKITKCISSNHWVDERDDDDIAFRSASPTSVPAAREFSRPLQRFGKRRVVG